jgi:hypothetical protein
MKMAKGDIITWLNSDDYYEYDALKNIAEVFINNTACNFAYGNLTFVDENKSIIFKEKTEKYDLKNLIYKYADGIRQPCSFFRKKNI